MARHLILALACMAPLLASGACAADWPERKEARVNALVERFMAGRRGAPRGPALSLAIGVDGELAMAKGFGEARAGVPASPSTTYRIGSLTKQFTAAAVLHLIEAEAIAPLSRRRLSLDTAMGEVFEGVERWSAEDEPPITVRSLLSMTSNLPNFTRHPPRDADPWGAVAMPKLLAALKELPPHGWPNTFEYSNTSYFLLARLVEATAAATGRPVSAREYVRTNILKPAHLEHTGFAGEDAPGADEADPHYSRRPAFAMPHWLDGCGDMTSTASDLFAWNKALIGGRIIGAAGLRAMLSDGARVDPLTFYGMGWFISHEEGWDSFYHSGSVPGFTSYNAIVRRQGSSRWFSVTLLTNSDGVEGLDALADDILEVVRSEK